MQSNIIYEKGRTASGRAIWQVSQLAPQVIAVTMGRESRETEQ